MLQNMFEHKPTLSFEVFPPKKDGDFESAFQVMDALGRLSPDFISVTYGAGGGGGKSDTARIAGAMLMLFSYK